MTTQTSKSPQAQQTKFSELSLMSESDVKKSVLLTSRAKSEEQLCEGALLELGIRAHEMLNVDKQKQIPVKPTLIAERFINELEALGVSDAARDIAMTQFNRVCISALPPCYKMLNQVLVKHGSAPDISKNPEWQARMRSSIHSKYESAARQTP